MFLLRLSTADPNNILVVTLLKTHMLLAIAVIVILVAVALGLNLTAPAGQFRGGDGGFGTMDTERGDFFFQGSTPGLDREFDELSRQLGQRMMGDR